jgi:hypothetical protein
MRTLALVSEALTCATACAMQCFCPYAEGLFAEGLFAEGLFTPKALANFSPGLERQRQPWVIN